MLHLQAKAGVSRCLGPITGARRKRVRGQSADLDPSPGINPRIMRSPLSCGLAPWSAGCREGRTHALHAELVDEPAQFELIDGKSRIADPALPTHPVAKGHQHRYLDRSFNPL